MFAEGEDISLLAPTLAQGLSFLWHLFNEGLGYSAINTARSALSAVVSIDNVPFGQHRLVTRFLKAVFEQRPALPRNLVTWDADVVLNYLRTLSPVKSLPLKQLTLKLVMLLLLLSGQRQQSIHLLDVRNMQLSFSYAKFQIGEPVKTTRPGHHLQELAFKGFARDRRLCIITVLKAYLQRTLISRGSTKRLLLTYGKPIHAASRSSIRRWAAEVLLEAGVDLSVFSPHSTRAASTSKAVSRVPLSTIMGAAGWKRESTFREYYDKKVGTSADFEQAVLKGFKKK